MSDRWEKTLDRSKDNYVKLIRLSPGLSLANQPLTKIETNALDLKTRELIALAVAVTTGCKECIAVHARKAASAGVTTQELGEALQVAVSVNAGTVLSHAGKIVDAYESMTEDREKKLKKN